MRRFVALGLLVGAAGCAFALDRPPVLAIEVRARAIEPGEPLRVEIASTAPLKSLDGEFLGQNVHFVRRTSTEAGERFSGWTMVPLDQTPGPALIEVRAADARDRIVPGTYALTIRPKQFPEEKLAVSRDYVEPPQEVEARIAREQARTKAIYARRSDTAPPDEPLVRPVPGEPTSIFGTRRLYNGEPRAPHPGLDLRAADGTPVRCAGPGLVALADDLYYSGRTVIVDHGGGLFTIYAHLSAIDVREGQALEAGTLIGRSGHTGRVTGPHLHWGAKIGDQPFDPTALLDPALFR